MLRAILDETHLQAELAADPRSRLAEQLGEDFRLPEIRNWPCVLDVETLQEVPLETCWGAAVDLAHFEQAVPQAVRHGFLLVMARAVSFAEAVAVLNRELQIECEALVKAAPTDNDRVTQALTTLWPKAFLLPWARGAKGFVTMSEGGANRFLTEFERRVSTLNDYRLAPTVTMLRSSIGAVFRLDAPNDPYGWVIDTPSFGWQPLNGTLDIYRTSQGYYILDSDKARMHAVDTQINRFLRGCGWTVSEDMSMRFPNLFPALRDDLYRYEVSNGILDSRETYNAQHTRKGPHVKDD